MIAAGAFAALASESTHLAYRQGKLLAFTSSRAPSLGMKESVKDDNSAKADIVARICEALSVHAEIEEEIFNPAAREALSEKGEDLVDEAEVEHESIKSLANREGTLCRTTSDSY